MDLERLEYLSRLSCLVTENTIHPPIIFELMLTNNTNFPLRGNLLVNVCFTAPKKSSVLAMCYVPFYLGVLGSAWGSWDPRGFLPTRGTFLA